MTEKSKQRAEFIINCVYVICIAGIIYLVFKYVIGLVMPFLFAFCLVASIHSIIRAVNRKLNMKKEVLSVVILALLYILIGGGIFGIITQLIFLLREAFTVIPGYFQDTIMPILTDFLSWGEHIFESSNVLWGINLDTVEESLMSGIQNLVLAISQKGISFVTNFTNNIPSFLITLIFTIMLSFFISIQYDKVLNFLKSQLTDRAKTFLLELKEILVNTIFKYLRAYLILMLITFIELGIGLLILGTPNGLMVAAGIAIFDALPLVGTGAIMIPWVIIEFIQGNITYGVGIGIVYGVVTIVRNIIEPKIVGDQLGMNPIVSLMSIYLGQRLFGLFGMILFPILMQIILALHKNERIRIFD